MRASEPYNFPAKSELEEYFTWMPVCTVLLSVFFLMQVTRISAQEKRVENWGSSFQESCHSIALDTNIEFAVRLPPKIDVIDKYPLVVVIKAGLKVAPGAEFPFIEVKPPTGGIWGYRSMTAVLVRTVIKFMKQHYPIDEDRVYLVGFSAGASGAMQLASTDADQFAAVLPLVAVGTDYSIANFLNLPVAQHHGTLDWTSSICNARGQHQRMKAMGCPASLIEYEGIGHSVPLPHEPIFEWMLRQKRDRSPRVVTLECETVDSGKAYWLGVNEFIDPHRRAKVRAIVAQDGLRINAENVAELSIDFALLPMASSDYVEVDDQRIVTDGVSGKVRFVLEVSTQKWFLRHNDINTHSEPRHMLSDYHAGAAANLYQGDPLLVVYGSNNGSTERTAQMVAAAKRLAACGGPHAGSLTPSFRVVADRDLTPAQLKGFNLILLGTPEENLITQRLFSMFPLAVDHKELLVDGRKKLSLRDRVLSLIYPNPESQKCLVYIVAPFLEGDTNWEKFAENPQRFLIGGDGFDRISQADLAVKNLDQQFCLQMQFNKNWKWNKEDGTSHKIAGRFGERSELAREFMKNMREKSRADYALWWGPADQGMWGHDLNFLPRYNPNAYTVADYRTQHREVQTLIGNVTGVELREIWNRWGPNEEMIFEPLIDLSTIQDGESYQLHIPMDFYIKLGQRKKNLLDPRPGPQIGFEELAEVILQN